MSRVLFSSDWHFKHEFVAGTRGFDTSEEHDEWLIDNMNSRVNKRDHLWFLGDLTIGSTTVALDLVERINGVKHIVFGNHDAGHPMHKRSHTKLRQYLTVFESAHLHEQMRLPGGRDVLLSHLPFAGGGDHSLHERYKQWRLHDNGRWLLCGHVHTAWPSRGRQVNVGVDFSPEPITADEIEEFIQDQEEYAGRN